MYHNALSRRHLSHPDLVEPDPCALLAARRTAYLAYLRRHISDPGTAEDVLQDFGVKVIRAARRPAPIGNTEAWLARILRNTLFDHYRRSDARRRAEAAYTSHVEVFATTADAESDRIETLLREENLVTVEAALTNIRSDYADLIRALYLRGVPRYRLAQQLQLAVGTLNVRAFRARRALCDEVARLRAGSLVGDQPASVGFDGGINPSVLNQARAITNHRHGELS